MRLLTPMPATLLLAASAFLAVPAQAGEKDELALTLTQLEQIQASLERARIQANQESLARFYFDYTQASKDIELIRQGITRYLDPSRAQPTVPVNVAEPLRGDYRREQR
ncbi:RAQPRD family integrative conjugative element protein [Providencia hangzhouensis]|uniref:Integrative conjugative element protein, RAQPRD family n=1 Tax=Providencia rettgeri TaxID=587 RepID=A0A9N8D1B5_PRORE|nr:MULTISPECIES: RAQPRD family integrative conjugative element protein [Providencia]MCB4855643.1 integrative conjugative element protein, RAQPRD family [Providencia rettgeri]MCW4539366.1 RAQPRD family integrative conjugative element protein [Providencia rettgeri]MDX4117354.1 RAQPRD family integrative conjugative element protein [Providencia rettgeri]CAB5649823.1 integrative conjugative element protein, RAQPRD family [Providencia rettgeri]CAB5688890.1 integrative conjugative element protein, RA